jgi:molecular chaperone HtpG
MDIPEHLAQKMQSNAELYGAVLLSISEFKPWFNHSKTPFFPEYTDHNWSHVTQTVATAVSLIRDEAWYELTPEDACVCMLAVLLHDCGMHLSEDGFLALINDKPNSRSVDGWPDESWGSLWTDFLGEASRYDARKLIALFGDTKPVHPPLPDSSEWTHRDRLLIGEFLRRHHHRLAHEIAVHGVPRVGKSPLKLIGVPRDLADLAGLIARSHGMRLRSCIPALSRFDLRTYKGIHAVFLMCVLRTADYLQVQAERAPRQMLHVKKLRSPLSQGEWAAHEAIRDIRTTHEDPEAIYIDAEPKTAATFLRLKRLLTGLQEEMDAAWAVLGEVYGRFGTLQRLGMTLRRVRSNLDDPKFSESVAYIPTAATFDSSGADLLKLLIQPLYGEKPEIGLRELVQNAVDSCRELGTC